MNEPYTVVTSLLVPVVVSYDPALWTEEEARAELVRVLLAATDEHAAEAVRVLG